MKNLLFKIQPMLLLACLALFFLTIGTWFLSALFAAFIVINYVACGLLFLCSSVFVMSQSKTKIDA